MNKKSMILYIIAAVVAVSGIVALAQGNITGGVECIVVAAVLAGVGFILSKRGKAGDSVEKQGQFSGNSGALTKDGERLLNTIRTKVVGVTFDNEDGTNRQDLLKTLHGGEQITIEPYQYKQEPAAYVKHNGRVLGNLSAELAAELDRKYRDAKVTAVVTEITGGDDLTYGCNIEIKVRA